MNYKAESIKPYNDTDSKTGQVRQMFDSIAPAYDFMNRAMTLGIDRLWRRKAVRMLGKSQPQHILDEVYGDLPLDRPDLFFTEETPIHTRSEERRVGERV